MIRHSSNFYKINHPNCWPWLHVLLLDTENVPDFGITFSLPTV